MTICCLTNNTEVCCKLFSWNRLISRAYLDSRWISFSMFHNGNLRYSLKNFEFLFRLPIVSKMFLKKHNTSSLVNQKLLWMIWNESCFSIKYAKCVFASKVDLWTHLSSTSPQLLLRSSSSGSKKCPGVKILYSSIPIKAWSSSKKKKKRKKIKWSSSWVSKKDSGDSDWSKVLDMHYFSNQLFSFWFPSLPPLVSAHHPTTLLPVMHAPQNRVSVRRRVLMKIKLWDSAIRCGSEVIRRQNDSRNLRL